MLKNKSYKLSLLTESKSLEKVMANYDTVISRIKDEYEHLIPDMVDTDDEGNDVDEDQYLTDQIDDALDILWVINKKSPITIWRIISVADFKDYIKKLALEGNVSPEYNNHIGIYWSHDSDNLETYWGDMNHKYKIVFEAEVKRDAVDWETTLVLGAANSEESEIRLEEDADVNITNIYFSNKFIRSIKECKKISEPILKKIQQHKFKA